MSVSSIQGSIYLQDEFSEYKHLNKAKPNHKKRRIVKLQYQGYIPKAEQWKHRVFLLFDWKNKNW